MEINKVNHMGKIGEAAKEHSCNLKITHETKKNITREDFEKSFIAGVVFAQQFINVEDELPESLKQDDEGIFYSEYLLIKVKGYEHPFVGFYVKANDDEFFDFIQDYIQEWISQEDIIGWRLIELK